MVICERPHKHGHSRAPQGSLTLPVRLRYVHSHVIKTIIRHMFVMETSVGQKYQYYLHLYCLRVNTKQDIINS